VLAWIPAVCLTLILLLTFFPWVGSYVGSTAVYSQNAWRALAGMPYVNLQLEDAMKAERAWPTDVLNRVQKNWELLPYILALLLALTIAWAERLVASLDRSRMPPQLRWVTSIWPYRIPIVAGLATVTLLLLLIQMASGFGLERAAERVVSEKFAAERAQNASDPAKLVRISYKEQEELARFKLEHTTWLYLALLLNILVVLAMIVRAWLDRRGNKPPPRIVFQY
jgi:hypothetical protein